MRDSTLLSVLSEVIVSKAHVTLNARLEAGDGRRLELANGPYGGMNRSLGRKIRTLSPSSLLDFPNQPVESISEAAQPFEDYLLCPFELRVSVIGYLRGL